MEFIQSTGARNHFSTSYEQWQNGLADAAINSIMRLARTVLAESGLRGRFWFKAALAGKTHAMLRTSSGSVKFQDLENPKYPDGFITHYIIDDMIGTNIFKNGRSLFTNLCISNGQYYTIKYYHLNSVYDDNTKNNKIKCKSNCFV
jgi:hypothetical protein